MRFNLKTVAGMLCLAVCISKAHATLLAYEPFNYASIANGTAVAGVGESGTWACGSAPSLVTGLTYTGLPTANSAMQSSGGRQAVTFTSSLSSGTKWISFLFQSGSGNSGGNINGIYFSNGGTGLWFGFGLAPNSPTQGGLGIGSMDTTGISALGASSLASSYLGTYGSVYFVAIQIQYGAGTGGHDLVTVYLNPTANSATPVVASTYSVGTFSVGTITGVGLNVQGAGSITVDEIRIGSSYGDVSGYVGVSPSAPTGLNATPGVNQVSLSWTASTGSPTSYNVKRSTNSAGPFTAIGTTTAPTVAYTDAVLGGQTYYYVVSAVNGAGESANSSPAVSASPTLGVPAAPTGLAAIPGSAQVALSWNSSAFAASYNVNRSTASGAETFLTNVTTTSFIDVAVVNGTTYYYKVSATNAAGQSANSSEVNAAPFASQTIYYYVSPTGSDTNAGSIGQPFATLARAQSAVRTINTNMTGDIIVYLRGGTYALTNTLALTPADSGNNGHQVRYQAYAPETPVISGGKTITGWILHDAGKNIWQAGVAATDNFRQLYVNGVKAVRAYGAPPAGYAVITDAGYTTTDTNLQFYGNITNLEIVTHSVNWTQSRLPVAGIQNTNITIQQPCLGLAQNLLTSPTRMENAYEFLTSPGYWYLNLYTHTLYYIPRAGENLATATVEAPVVEQLITITGDSTNPVSNLSFVGLTFRLANWLQPSTGLGLASPQANQDDLTTSYLWVVKAALDCTGARNVGVTACTFANLGGDGVNFLRASQNDTIDGCVFYDIAASAVQVARGSLLDAAIPAGSGDIVSNIVVKGCLIHDVCTDYQEGCGIYFGYTANCTISHNELYNLPYTGISLGWGWGPGYSAAYAGGNQILYNKIHDHLQVLADGGGIYVNGTQPNGNSLIAWNYIYNQGNVFGEIYLDDGASNWTVTSNVCKKASAATWYLYKGSNNNADDNYTDDPNPPSDGATGPLPCTVTNTTVVTNGIWPQGALDIINAAGSESGTPAAPTGLVAIPGSAQVALSWNSSSFAASYNVKRSTASGGTYTTIGTTTAPTTNYTDTVTGGSTYYYEVSAVNGGGESANSSYVSASPTLAVFVNVYEPFNYALIASGTAVTGVGESSTWTCGSAPSVVTGLTYTGLPTANSAMQSSGGRQAVTFTSSLSSGTKWISFLFKNSAGNPGDFRYGVYFPNGGTGLFFGYVGAYSPTQGNLGIGSMDTTGTSALGASSLANSYLGTYGNTYFVVLKIDFNTSGANDTVTVYINPMANSATPGVTATYTVTSFDVGTITGIGLNVQGSTLTVDEIRTGSSYGDVSGYVSIPPNPPAGLNAAPGTNLVSLSWTAATGSPTGYNVKRATVSGGPFTNIGTTTAPIVNYNDSVLGGQTFYYVVTAVNGSGESTNSLQVSAAPTLGAPAAPTGLAATADNAQVTLIWTASAFATSYNVKRSSVFGGPYTLVGTTTAPTVTYTDSSGLNNGTTYYYVVSATGTGGTSADISPVSATPVAPIPFLIAIAPGVGITWFASNSVTYQVQWSSALLGSNTVWNNLRSSIAGNGSTNSVFDPVGPPHNFFQVLSIQ